MGDPAKTAETLNTNTEAEAVESLPQDEQDLLVEYTKWLKGVEEDEALEMVYNFTLKR